MARVDNEAFYATAAQVLPTVLIAIAVETNLLMQRQRRHLEESHAAVLAEFEALVEATSGLSESGDRTSRATVLQLMHSVPVRTQKELFEAQRALFVRHQRAMRHRRRLAL